jgi:hypothetical protein
VLKKIVSRYTLADALPARRPRKAPTQSQPWIPDRELGHLGEREIYDRELAHAKKIGADPKLIKWVSQSVPSSPFDIESIRKTANGFVLYYLEVKSSTMPDYTNVYLSSGQDEFFRQNKENVSIVFVKFDNSRNVETVKYLTVDELYRRFELVPINFKLRAI